MTVKAVSRVVFITLLAGVTVLTLTNNQEVANPGAPLTRFLADLLLGNANAADKIGHFSAYGVLGVTIVPARFFLPRQVWRSVAALALYGVFLEILQGIGGVRTMEAGDALANALGAIAGCMVSIAISALAQRVRHARA
ncbi:MAG: VanZ family protein [Pseudomonadota bacterium]